jgi:hypothetical protein
VNQPFEKSETVAIDLDGIIGRHYLAALNERDPGGMCRHWEQAIREAFAVVGVTVVQPPVPQDTIGTGEI